MDFPKTIYATKGHRPSGDTYYWGVYIEENEPDLPNGYVAIYTLKEVKKKVTEVKLENI